MNKSFIKLQSVSKAFTTLRRETVDALQDISMEVTEGEFVSIIGPSGCGKSTLLKLMGGLLQPSSGGIMVEGKPLSGPIGNVGFVFQHPTLFPWRTVLRNVMLPVDIRKLDPRKLSSKARDLINLVGLQGFENKYPFELSGGMQQRVSIARALMNDPKVLLMDEPFGALDALTREQMGLELLKIWEKLRITAVFVTHDIAEAVFLSSRVLTMSPRPGRLTGEVEIALPRPRDLAVKIDPTFAAYTNELRGALGLVGEVRSRGR